MRKGLIVLLLLGLALALPGQAGAIVLPQVETLQPIYSAQTQTLTMRGTWIPTPGYDYRGARCRFSVIYDPPVGLSGGGTIPFSCDLSGGLFQLEWPDKVVPDTRYRIKAGVQFDFIAAEGNEIVFELRNPVLSVTKSGSGAGTITSTPAGIDCGLDCSESFSQGTQVTLTATPTAGSIFNGWSGSGCSGTGTSCGVTMREAQSVAAIFAANHPVPPTSEIEVSMVKAKVHNRLALITSKVQVSGKGKILQQATAGENRDLRVWCKTSKTVGAAGIYELKCNLGHRGRKVIRKQTLKLTLRTTFTPAEGSKVTADRKVTIKLKR